MGYGAGGAGSSGQGARRALPCLCFLYSEGVCERPGRTSTGEVLLVPAASRLGLVPARSRPHITPGLDFGCFSWQCRAWCKQRTAPAWNCRKLLEQSALQRGRACLQGCCSHLHTGADLPRMLSICQRKNTMLEGKPIYKCVPTERISVSLISPKINLKRFQETEFRLLLLQRIIYLQYEATPLPCIQCHKVDQVGYILLSFYFSITSESVIQNDSFDRKHAICNLVIRF
ncbi:uncharacterized protein [Anas platyrhynchos]|uniref:uncharacterized protein n=1 Tax=Anas platyrhynchos TaxID=8839 RepID=UPI003AF29C2A